MKRPIITRALLFILLMLLLPTWTVTAEVGDFDLSQELTLDLPEMGTLTVYIPESWAAQVHADGVLFIADSESTLDKALTDEADEFGPGEQSAVIFALPQTDYVFYDLPPDATVEAATEAVLAAQVADGYLADPQFSAVKSFFANDRPAALTTGFAAGGDYDYGTVIGKVEVNGGMVELFSACNPADTPTHTALMWAIMAQMEFAPAVSVDVHLPQRLAADVPLAGTYSLNYPDGWHAQSMGGGMMLITNSEGLMERALTPGLPDIDSGEAGILAVAIPDMLLQHMDSLPVTEHSLPEEVLSAYLIMMNDDGAETEFVVSAARPLTLGDTPAAIASGSAVGPETTNALTIVALAFADGGGFVFLLLQTALDDEGEFDDILTGIAETYTFTPDRE